MGENKHKILVLSDLKDNTNCVIENAVKLSKKIDATIQFFYVKKLLDVVTSDSQLSAMRAINTEYIATDKKINDFIAPICKIQDVHINTSFTFGNVKNEIENAINTYQPDVIVLGSRTPKVLSFIGDNITDFVIKKHQGAVIIASKINGYDPIKKLTLDVLNKERVVIKA